AASSRPLRRMPKIASTAALPTAAQTRACWNRFQLTQVLMESGTLERVSAGEKSTGPFVNWPHSAERRATAESGINSRSGRRRRRQGHGRPETFAQLAIELQPAAVKLRESLDHRQAKTSALGMFGAFAMPGMLKRFQDARQVFRRHAAAIVFHRQRNAAFLGRRRKRDAL